MSEVDTKGHVISVAALAAMIAAQGSPKFAPATGMYASGFRRTILCLSLIQVSLAHSHSDSLTEEEANSPVDAILWIHIFLQAAVWGVIFPIGMVLGLSRSRWHVPLQVGRDIRPGQNLF